MDFQMIASNLCTSYAWKTLLKRWQPHPQKGLGVGYQHNSDNIEAIKKWF